MKLTDFFKKFKKRKDLSTKRFDILKPFYHITHSEIMQMFRNMYPVLMANNYLFYSFYEDIYQYVIGIFHFTNFKCIGMIYHYKNEYKGIVIIITEDINFNYELYNIISAYISSTIFEVYDNDTREKIYNKMKSVHDEFYYKHRYIYEKDRNLIKI